MDLLSRVFPLVRAAPALLRAAQTTAPGLDLCPVSLPCCWTQTRTYAARKGTREKARKKKVKVEVKKVGFVPGSSKAKALTKGPIESRRVRDDFKPLPIDDVYVFKYYRFKIHDFEEAVKAHRETHHPQIYNIPDAPIQAFIELDMRGPKKTKYVNSFTRIAKIPHVFDHGEDRSTVVFCKTPEVREEAELAGANLVCDVDTIKKMERGELVLPDFQFFLAHPNILPELLPLRGMLKKKFPSPRTGTLGVEIGDMVRKMKTGIQYWALQDERESDYGLVNVAFGRLNMDVAHLEENFKHLIDDINFMRPKREGQFITRVFLVSPPTTERFKVNLKPYLEELEEDSETDSDDEEPTRKAAAS